MNTMNSNRSYGKAIDRWFSLELDRDNPADVRKVDKLLRNVEGSMEADFYDEDFNGLSFEEVVSMTGFDLGPDYQRPDHVKYKVHKLSTNRLVQYRPYAEWCILDKEVWQIWDRDFYIAERSDYKSVPKAKGSAYPFDDYGMSLIAIGVKDGQIISVTSRWPSDRRGDNYMSESELRDILGDAWPFIEETHNTNQP